MTVLVCSLPVQLALVSKLKQGSCISKIATKSPGCASLTKVSDGNLLQQFAIGIQLSKAGLVVCHLGSSPSVEHILTNNPAGEANDIQTEQVCRKQPKSS